MKAEPYLPENVIAIRSSTHLYLFNVDTEEFRSTERFDINLFKFDLPKFEVKE